MSTRDDVTTAMGWFTGEDQKFSFAITDTNTALPVNILGWEIEWKFTDVLGDPPLIVVEAAITDAIAGICEVDVPSAATIDLPPGTYYYDLRKTNMGSFSLLAYGTIDLQNPYVDEEPWGFPA